VKIFTSMPSPKQFAAPMLLVCSLLLTSCTTLSYYSQSVSGHLEIWWGKQDIEKLLSDNDTSPELKNNLQEILRYRQFASDQLGLPDNDSYKSYYDLKRDSVVWNVFAAAEFSTKPKRWCYLIVGCVSYRGYYDEARALEHALHLKQEGFDTYVGSVPAYSTLGWFNDPVLNTFVNWKADSLAGLIFHELSHQVLYISDDSAFNEAFATAVQRLGVLEWYRINGDSASQKNYLEFLKQLSLFRKILINTKEKLNVIYSSDLSEQNKKEQKSQIFNGMIVEYENVSKSWGKDPFRNWFKKELNNARLIANLEYIGHIPAFYALFAQNNKDWKRFLSACIKLSQMKKPEREKRLAELTAENISLENVVL